MTQDERKFSWIQTHKELVEYLVDKEDDQIGLIEILRKVGITPLNDEAIKGEKTDLLEIDPFTFFCYIYKYGSERRLSYLQKIAEYLNLSIPIGEAGVPSANAQSVWLFPYKYIRTNNEIKRLWTLFHAAINNQITDEQFDDVLNIKNVAKTKLTEALFNVDPERYLPINGPTKPYIEEELGIKASFNSYSEYIAVLNQIRNKTNIPFYELSYRAWEWNNEKNMESGNWTDEELKAAVYSYMEMFEKQHTNESFIKQEYYKKLASKYNRTEKAFGYRMQNISHVLKKMGREWLEGLAPAKNVGTNTEKKIVKFIHEYESKNVKLEVDHQQFDLDVFITYLDSSGLLFSKKILSRFVSSLITKPFVILTGLSGSGKTKLAQVFAQCICENESQYKLIPVGADWTNREPLLGYPNALESGKYVLPENGALNLILEASREENQSKPYFLILDEMNLSHVERYFADFLSAMESGEDIPIHPESKDWKDDIPAKIKLPKNLFIVGTVNIDETTYMFSPKVLDRANVIEFRVSETEMEQFLNDIKPLDLSSINGLGANMAASFVELTNNKDLKPVHKDNLNTTLISFFNELKKTGAEFGYRSASEIHRFVAVVNQLEPDWEMEEIIDCAIMQKLLPKVHGSRRKLEPVLKTLGSLCLADGKTIEEIFNRKTDVDFNDPAISKYPLSLEKIDRMYKGLIDNGFTSYAEA